MFRDRSTALEARRRALLDQLASARDALTNARLSTDGAHCGRCRGAVIRGGVRLEGTLQWLRSAPDVAGDYRSSWRWSTAEMDTSSLVPAVRCPACELCALPMEIPVLAPDEEV